MNRLLLYQQEVGELSQIKIDLSVVSQLNDGSKRHANELSNLAGNLSSVTSQVDSQIKARRSIGTRLRSSTQRVEEMGIKLKQIQTFISGGIERYGQLDKEIVSQSSRLEGIGTSGDKQNWWEKLTGGAAAGISEISGLASKAANEFQSGVAEVLSHTTREALELYLEVREAKEKVIDFVEDTAKEAIETLESSAVGSFVEGVADAVTENVLLGIPQHDSDTDHQKSYLAGKIVGDLASEAIGFVEGMAAVGMEGVGIALDSTGIGAIAGVGLNVTGLAVLGHASTVMYNGASNLGKDAGDLVQSIRNGSSEGAGKSDLDIIREDAPDYYHELIDKYGEKGNYHGRTPDEYEDLARDPDHNFNIDDKTRIERQAGLELEVRGELTGPIVRDPVKGRGEFIDKNGQVWDVKGFNSNYPTKKGGFRLDRAMEDIEDELRKGENVILDTTKLSQDHIEQLKNAISTMEWQGKVRWWP